MIGTPRRSKISSMRNLTSHRISTPTRSLPCRKSTSLCVCILRPSARLHLEYRRSGPGLYTNCRLGFFSETGLPVYGVLGNPALSCVAYRPRRTHIATQDKTLREKPPRDYSLAPVERREISFTSFVLNTSDFGGVLRCQVDVEIVHPLALFYCV